ncbi:MAG: imidazole glycerol phosphate synthase subunit HisH [Alphaproteobacteria bacterium]|nr:imidazole glycerol phosphate synthase subunit HisH [Alphaproteobacteria bacterium]
MTVAIVDYGSGNLRSAAKAFERAALAIGLSETIQVTSDPDRVARADRVVLPGVGAFGACRAGLDGLDGMVEAIEAAALGAGRPFLGICVGMQLMASLGLEHGEHAGLGWIEGEVVALEPNQPGLKVPHMGWNELVFQPGVHPVLAGLDAGAHTYFLHSYQLRPADPAICLAVTDHGGAVTAVVGRDNLIGTQFHPEKSQANGLRIIANFLRWRP